MSAADKHESGPSSSSSIPEPETPELMKDEDYFIDDYFVEFEVEGHLFRVPTYQFSEESPEFVEIYNIRGRAQDKSDPIVLEQVSHNDFRNLLKALYPLSISLELPLTKEEWISALKLSTEWKFLHLREVAKTALERLSVMTPVDKICLGRQVRVTRWVIEGFTDLVQRHDTISDDEAIDIDWDVLTTAYKLFRLRELRIAGRLSSVKSRIEETFQAELDHIRSDERNFDNEEIIRMKELKLKEAEEQRMREEEEQRRREWEDSKRIEEEEAAREQEQRELEEAERASTLHRKLKSKKKKGHVAAW